MESNIIKTIGNVEVLSNPNLTKSIDNDKQSIIQHFTKDEMIFLLSKVPPSKDGMIFQFLWRSGVRVSELINIRKNNIDFQNDEISIRWLKSRKANYRVIPLHNSLKQILYLFTAKMLDKERIFSISRQRVDQLCKKYGFDHAHKIRHSFAINFLRQSDSSMALIELKDLLGHSNINTTMEYLKIVPQNTKKAMKNISFD